MDVIGRSKRLIIFESLREQPFSELAPPGQLTEQLTVNLFSSNHLL